MQNTLPKQQTEQQNTWWQALVDLDFLSSFFSWFFMLLTRLSEPLMLLSTLYVVAETGVPPIASPALHNLAIGIMITAPELILPGAFVVAARAQQYARWLFAVCCAFVALTLITLVSLFVWHFTGQALAWLMCARCAAAVGYSILMRVMNHGQRVNQTVQQVNQQQQEMEERIAEITNQFSTHLQVVQNQMIQQVRELVQAQVSGQVQRSQTAILEQVTTHVQNSQSTMAEQVQASQHAMMEQFTGQLAATAQEFKRELRNAIAEMTVASSPKENTPAKPIRQLRSVTPLVHSEPGNEPASEPANVRVPRFIQEQVNQGHKPTLSEIEEACQCSRNTAIRYRRELLGDEGGA